MTSRDPDQGGGLLSGFREGDLVEAAAVERLVELGWRHQDLMQEAPETPGGDPRTGRTTFRQAMLPKPLGEAVRRLNPELDDEAVSAVFDELMRHRSSMTPVAANREVIALLKDGVEVRTTRPDGETETVVARIIDWRGENDFLLGQQVWFRGEIHTRRADLVGFVNGVPLLFVELKGTHRNARAAYDENLRDNRDTIPHVFWGNGFVLLSNGEDARIGAPYAGWEHFKEWKRIDDEGSVGVVSLDTVLTAACSPERLLDIVENFLVFEETRDGLVKKVAQNHQYLGVNKAVAEVSRLGANRGRLGVFWHTQGSGKSISMITFAAKVLRTLPGAWTFLIVTDRAELDKQIAETFQACGVLNLPLEEVQAQNRDHLKVLLSGNTRFIFTLIQKFGTAMGETYPELSQRDDIIVITDEAHRSQYDVLAANMRRALPNAAFIGFTGTPLMAGEEKTREVFGDYVSVYNFSQSVADGATVPLYYENRIPELQLTVDDLDEAVDAIIEDADLDEEETRQLERKLARQYHLITREDRLERIAVDLVQHFAGRGYRGKAMFIAIDKATAVRTHDKVRAHWLAEIGRREAALVGMSDEAREAAEAEIAWMRETDMAVIVSQGQNEIDDMAKRGLDIRPHRARMVREKMDEKFKASDDPFRLAFVCAMWITGFDVPTCSTIYLDKPMKNHSLMQTIARANRTAPGKTAGLIVDYVGVFRSLQKALAIYAQPSGGGEKPIEDKAALVRRLEQAAAGALDFCDRRGIDPRAIIAAKGFERIRRLQDAVDAVMGPDREQLAFLRHADDVWVLFKAVLPDPAADAFRVPAAVLHVIAEKVRTLRRKDVSHVVGRIEALLDDAIAGVDITAPIRGKDETEGLFDLSRIDFEKLKAQFETGRKRTEAQRLRAAVERKLGELAAQNPTRTHLVERFRKMIAEYNAGSLNVERLFDELLKFVQDLNEEDSRAVREGLSEEELAIFDVLTKPAPDLSATETDLVKRVARSLLDTLTREKLVLDWRLKERAKAAVRSAIQQALDDLPPAFDDALWQTKVEKTYEWVYEHYPQ
jgi:type I restriction enzyme, R subunit